MLALAYEREHQPQKARDLLAELAVEFPAKRWYLRGSSPFVDNNPALLQALTDPPSLPFHADAVGQGGAAVLFYRNSKPMVVAVQLVRLEIRIHHFPIAADRFADFHGDGPSL